jgi:hypothetical protein
VLSDGCTTGNRHRCTATPPSASIRSPARARTTRSMLVRFGVGLGVRFKRLRTVSQLVGDLLVVCEHGVIEEVDR